ncbi:MAG: leucine--tRNA ligase [Bacteroidota bacterium]|nr:leucine--tRNA ligase [Bacteroidota bacterium]
MHYPFNEAQKAVRSSWEEAGIYRCVEDASKQKYYVLDMFPYPSGSGLHVGHPLGYIASDIYARYKRQKGFNVLHPMGFDSFGLPAEQYAIQTGKHPRDTTKENKARFKNQLANLDLSYDWSREVTTSSPSYYRWTQSIFLKLFNHYYCTSLDKALPIEELVKIFEQDGNVEVNAACDEDTTQFTADQWQSMNEKQQADILMKYRLAYRKESMVNWCEALGTVLANDEVVQGVSERGGHPVVKKPMVQWTLRITAYAERLYKAIDELDWTDALKAMQRNWIGKSIGANLTFPIEGSDEGIEVFTTRPDTIYGVTFMVLAPEHPLVAQLTTSENSKEVEAYKDAVSRKSSIERQQDKSVDGRFTGSFAVHPLTGDKIPIYISAYVLIDYGKGAVMAVPAEDDRDNAFAKHFSLPIREVINRTDSGGERGDKQGQMMNSASLDGLAPMEAIQRGIEIIRGQGIGDAASTWKLRDANFSRQRYWGEPFPIYYREGIACPVDEADLPLELPDTEDFTPKGGEGPLSRVDNWAYKGFPLETDTMPGYAGSSWYFLRFMDPSNTDSFLAKDKADYWQDVDFYVGGTEHAVGHLLYARFWHKFLFDLGLVATEEPFKRLFNQGMIQGQTCFIYRDAQEANTYYSADHSSVNDSCQRIRILTSLANDKGEVDIDELSSWRPEFQDAVFHSNDKGLFIGEFETEKMSKSKHNVVNPDDIVTRYGSDCFRLYSMFLGPIEEHKPWNNQGIDGVYRFMNKFWRLIEASKGVMLDASEAKSSLQILHTLIEKVDRDLPKLGLNTCISAFMIAVNDWQKLDKLPQETMKEALRVIAPFAPVYAQYGWELLDGEGYVLDQGWPKFDASFLQMDTITLALSFNGKRRGEIEIDANADNETIESIALSSEVAKKWMEGKNVVKVIVVPGRMVNVVLR